MYYSNTFVRFTLLLTLIFCVVISGCKPANQSLTSASPAWRDAIVVGEAFSSHPPGIGAAPDHWFIVWAQGNDLVARRVDHDGTLGDIQVVVPARTPWEPQLFTAPNGAWHLIWYDLDQYGQTHLYSGHIAPDGTLERGPMEIAVNVSEVSIAPGDGYTLVIIWSNTDTRPSIYGMVIDEESRPIGEAALIAHNANYPALNRTQDSTWLIDWLALPDTPSNDQDSFDLTVQFAAGSNPWEAVITQFTLPNFIGIANATTYIETTALALSQEHGYHFTVLRDAQSQAAETRLVSFTLSTDEIILPENSLVRFPAETGRSNGDLAATPEHQNIAEWYATTWPTAISGQHDLSPVSFNANGFVVVGYGDAGHITSHQIVNTNSQILGSTKLITDEAYLTLVWANRPRNSDDPAMFYLTTTRPVTSR